MIWGPWKFEGKKGTLKEWCIQFVTFAKAFIAEGKRWPTDGQVAEFMTAMAVGLSAVTPQQVAQMTFQTQTSHATARET